MGLSGNAGWCLTLSLVYCGKRLTDGRIPSSWVKATRSATRKAVRELKEAGLWEPNEDDSGYFIPRWREFVRPRAEAEADRERYRESRRNGGRAAAQKSQRENGRFTPTEPAQVPASHRHPSPWPGAPTPARMPVDSPAATGSARVGNGLGGVNGEPPTSYGDATRTSARMRAGSSSPAGPQSVPSPSVEGETLSADAAKALATEFTGRDDWRGDGRPHEEQKADVAQVLVGADRASVERVLHRSPGPIDVANLRAKLAVERGAV